MDNPETQPMWAIKNGHSRDTTDVGNKEWTIQRHWQHQAYNYKTRDENKQDTKTQHNTEV